MRGESAGSGAHSTIWKILVRGAIQAVGRGEQNPAFRWARKPGSVPSGGWEFCSAVPEISRSGSGDAAAAADLARRQAGVSSGRLAASAAWTGSAEPPTAFRAAAPWPPLVSRRFPDSGASPPGSGRLPTFPPRFSPDRYAPFTQSKFHGNSFTASSTRFRSISVSRRAESKPQRRAPVMPHHRAGGIQASPAGHPARRPSSASSA